MKTPPRSDASERSQQAELPVNGVPLSNTYCSFSAPRNAPKGLDSEARTTVDMRFRFCTCGCGNHASGHFVPGHNQRLRGALTRAYQRAQLVRVLQAISEPVLVAAPAAAALLGPEWLAWVAPDVEVRRSTEAAARASLASAADAFEAEWGAE